ncbi:MAG: ferredoxin [Gammaproteobacteria bacterium]|nr:ferredoxin [Gammaproteobacteria bacterium]
MTTPQATTEKRSTQIPGAGPERIPRVPTAVKDAAETRKLMYTLRHFHLGDPAAKAELETLDDDILPALLDPFRDTSRLRYDYPLFLFPPDSEKDAQAAQELACPVVQCLQKAVTSFAADDHAARILKDHLSWLEHHLRQLLASTEGPTPAAPLLKRAGEALLQHLGLDAPSAKQLQQDLAQLQAAVPADGMVLGYGRYAALHLLVHAVRSREVPRRVRFLAEIDRCIRGLKELFEVEWGKSDESIEPRMARDSVGPEGERFDPLALSTVIDHSRGTRRMSSERHQRIEMALEVLEQWRIDPVLVRFVHDSSLSGEWMQNDPTLADIKNTRPCACATELFDKQAAELAKTFAAVRIARLEIDNRYDPVIHDPWFANFDWEGFSHDELLLVPTVIAVESADRVAGDGLRSFSRLLNSGRPVQILIRVRPGYNPGARADEDPFQSYRTELGYLGISHRQAAVTQSSAARHEHLLQCYLSALDATRTSLHLINTGLRDDHKLVPLNAWLVAGAAIEGRAHPFFRINPQAGDSAEARMDFEDNPQLGLDWPLHPFQYLDENGNSVTEELAFTFADYTLLVEAMRDHFRLIPPGCDSDSLVSMQDYLAMPAEWAYQRVPFVWVVDNGAVLHRAVVSRELALACLDRLNFWHTLQEMAGVRNRHVDLAVAETRSLERRIAADERERLTAEHAAELDRVRDQAAGEAMQRLADVLLGMDLTMAMPTGVPKTGPAADSSEAKPTAHVDPEERQEPEPDDEEQLAFDEPWIDTHLCTSCNDCLEINPLLFLYNEEKQAYLGDLSTATYAQLVEAAELCPAKCIFPGKPWNPQEANLEELMERAAPFNHP